MSAKISKHVVLGVTASIAAYKSADIIRRLQDQGYRVTVVMTKEAEQFITPLTLASLSGQRVYRDMFDEKEEAWQMHHIQLAREADLLLIAPATANIIGKIACGLANDLLSCVAMATRAKILIAPAMNDEMYHNKIVQKNCRSLEELGVGIIQPNEGKLACGVTADGHLAEVERIVEEVESALK